MDGRITFAILVCRTFSHTSLGFFLFQKKNGWKKRPVNSEVPSSETRPARHRLVQVGVSFSSDQNHVPQNATWRSGVDMLFFFRERLSHIKLRRARLLNRNEPATEGPPCLRSSASVARRSWPSPLTATLEVGLRSSRGCVYYRLHGAMNSLAQSGHVEFNPGEMPWHPPGGALHPVFHQPSHEVSRGGCWL